MKKKWQNREHRPEWADKAEHIDHKPNWVGVDNHIVPRELWDLGRVFFPIPKLSKGWNYPHHLEEHRYKPTDEIFNAYIETGSGYGIVCAGSLIVVDIDAPGMVNEISSRLPDTLWQVTGSREGVHLFYECDGLNTRQTLYYNILDCWTHIGEVKCDPHGYVIGPGSVHPSGNTYGPLRGEEMASIEKDELLRAIGEYLKPVEDTTNKLTDREFNSDYESKYSYYNLDADDVVPWLSPENRVAHPGHGSESNANFMKNSDRETFTCWRHDYGNGPGCALNALQLLAQLTTGLKCDAIRRRWGDCSLYWHSWNEAVDRGLISYKSIPYNVAKGYAINAGWIEKDDDFVGDILWDAKNTIKIEVEKKFIEHEQD